ncbi:hypothetical protein RIVM261_071860 [Rivularia sp. IAM M-261]|nr:hypothetical protein CAL7716_019900 [Calothrix sp. PCC 7716]GJD22230.1 hypothetical protein RIVM261_071860 [Rivularia sp. IAM M-261]
MHLILLLTGNYLKLKAQVRAQFQELLNDEVRYKQALENPSVSHYIKDFLI